MQRRSVTGGVWRGAQAPLVVVRVDEFLVQYVLVVVRDRVVVVWAAAAAEDLLEEVLCILPHSTRASTCALSSFFDGSRPEGQLNATNLAARAGSASRNLEKK